MGRFMKSIHILFAIALFCTGCDVVREAAPVVFDAVWRRWGR